MFYYIYNLKSHNSEIDLKKLKSIEFELGNLKFNNEKLDYSDIIPKIDSYEFKNQIQINGTIFIDYKKSRSNSSTKSIDYKLRFGSGFALIQTDKERNKIEVVKAINTIFKDYNISLTEFVPRRDKSLTFICNSDELISATLFTEDGIKDINELIEKRNMNKKDILKEYPLVEADLKFKLERNEISLFYYGDAIQIPSNDEDKTETAIQIFEDAMSEKEFNSFINPIRRKIPETG